MSKIAKQGTRAHKTLEKSMKIKAPTKNECVRHVMDYIETHECDDFDENPSRDHIYYYAMVYRGGLKFAEEELREAIKKNDAEW